MLDISSDFNMEGENFIFAAKFLIKLRTGMELQFMFCSPYTAFAIAWWSSSVPAGIRGATLERSLSTFLNQVKYMCIHR